jgi:hypothetical protein
MAARAVGRASDAARARAASGNFRQECMTVLLRKRS